jgi:hypothetical protein
VGANHPLLLDARLALEMACDVQTTQRQRSVKRTASSAAWMSHPRTAFSSLLEAVFKSEGVESRVTGMNNPG